MKCLEFQGFIRLIGMSLGMMLASQAFAAAPIRSDPDYLIDTWETEDGLPENSATAMVQDADGFLLPSTPAGLVRFDGVKFTDIPLPVPGAGVSNLHMDQQRRLWAFTVAGVFVGKRDAPSRAGGMWLLFHRELRKFHTGAETAHVTLAQSPGGVSRVFEDSSGYVWISSHNYGLSRVSRDGTVRHWNTADGAFHSLTFCL